MIKKILMFLSVLFLTVTLTSCSAKTKTYSNEVDKNTFNTKLIAKLEENLTSGELKVKMNLKSVVIVDDSKTVSKTKLKYNAELDYKNKIINSKGNARFESKSTSNTTNLQELKKTNGDYSLVKIAGKTYNFDNKSMTVVKSSDFDKTINSMFTSEFCLFFNVKDFKYYIDDNLFTASLINEDRSIEIQIEFTKNGWYLTRIENENSDKVHNDKNVKTEEKMVLTAEFKYKDLKLEPKKLNDYKMN